MWHSSTNKLFSTTICIPNFFLPSYHSRFALASLKSCWQQYIKDALHTFLCSTFFFWSFSSLNFNSRPSATPFWLFSKNLHGLSLVVAICRLQRSFICTLLWCSLVALIVLYVVCIRALPRWSQAPHRCCSAQWVQMLSVSVSDLSMASTRTCFLSIQRRLRRCVFVKKKSVHWEENITLSCFSHFSG